MSRRKNYTETPGDISNLYISTSQIKLALASKLNKPIILVLNEGRPRLSDFEDKMSAVIQCYLPGNGRKSFSRYHLRRQTQVEDCLTLSEIS
jgi:hypothetical protein